MGRSKERSFFVGKRSRFSSSFSQVNEVKTRLVNSELRIDLDIAFKPGVTYGQEMAYLNDFQHRVAALYPGAQAQLVHLPQEEDARPKSNQAA